MTTPDPKRSLTEYLRLQVKVDRRVKGILNGIAADISADLRRLAGHGAGQELHRAQLRMIQHEIDRSIRRGWVRLADVIESEALAAAEAAVRADAGFDRALLSHGLSDAQRAVLTRSQVAAAQQSIRAALNRVLDDSGSTHVPLSEKVYRSRRLLSGEVDRLVNSALARNLNARQFAAEARKFIDPTMRGGVRYAANRLARTEINNAFHYAQRRDNAAKPWVSGQKWYLSGSHPKPDECNDFAEQNKFDLGVGVFPKTEVPNKPHPHCLCYIAPETVSEDQWLKDFNSGKYDSYLNDRIPASV